MTPPLDNSFEKAIRLEIERCAREIIEQESILAAARVKEAVKKKVGEVAAFISSEVMFERYGKNLRITVVFPEVTA